MFEHVNTLSIRSSQTITPKKIKRQKPQDNQKVYAQDGMGERGISSVIAGE